jgi:hypothetical protein
MIFRAASFSYGLSPRRRTSFVTASRPVIAGLSCGILLCLIFVLVSVDVVVRLRSASTALLIQRAKCSRISASGDFLAALFIRSEPRFLQQRAPISFNPLGKSSAALARSKLTYKFGYMCGRSVCALTRSGTQQYPAGVHGKLSRLPPAGASGWTNVPKCDELPNHSNQLSDIDQETLYHNSTDELADPTSAGL